MPWWAGLMAPCLYCARLLSGPLLSANVASALPSLPSAGSVSRAPHQGFNRAPRFCCRTVVGRVNSTCRFCTHSHSTVQTPTTETAWHGFQAAKRSNE
jgi:hypothetical protein